MRGVRAMALVVAAAGVFVAGLWTGTGGAGESGAAAEGIALTAALTARAEVPKPTGVSTSARGTFTATLVRRGTAGTLSWRLTFRGLTGKAIAAHVHLARVGRAGPVARALCGPCRSGARGSGRVNASTVRALLGGGAYVNVHTAQNPAGEIRGQAKRGGTGTQPTTPTGTTTTTTTATTTDPYP